MNGCEYLPVFLVLFGVTAAFVSRDDPVKTEMCLKDKECGRGKFFGVMKNFLVFGKNLIFSKFGHF
jgi:hypothetical protein